VFIGSITPGIVRLAGHETPLRSIGPLLGETAVCVTSAVFGITNRLIHLHALAQQGFLSQAQRIRQEISEFHLEVRSCTQTAYCLILTIEDCIDTIFWVRSGRRRENGELPD